MAKLRVLVVLLALVLAACAPATAPACVDVNTDPRERLTLIIHIGQVRSAEMLTLRPFADLDDLDRITGIGPDRLADIRAQGIVCPFDE
jgi:DNA uptake protein ComE-like DNA-binding protein